MAVVVAGGRRREAHTRSWFIFIKSWQSIIEKVFVGFSPPLGFPRIKFCVPCDCVSFGDPTYAIVLEIL